MKKIGKKGVLDQLAGLVQALAFLAILLAVVFLILATVRSNTQVVADGNATAAVNATTDAMADIPGWLPIIVIAVIGGLLITLVQFFRGRGK